MTFEEALDKLDDVLGHIPMKEGYALAIELMKADAMQKQAEAMQRQNDIMETRAESAEINALKKEIQHLKDALSSIENIGNMLKEYSAYSRK